MLNKLHAPIVFYGSAIAIAFLGAIFAISGAPTPSVYALQQFEDQQCLVDETNGVLAPGVEGEGMCTPIVPAKTR